MLEKMPRELGALINLGICMSMPGSRFFVYTSNLNGNTMTESGCILVAFNHFVLMNETQP